MALDEWKTVGAKIAVYSDASSWWLGDWLAFGQAKYGRRYKEGVALTGLDYQTLRNYAVVARRFALSRRRDSLSFQHHAEVCALKDADQDVWLDLATEHGWSRRELRRRRREGGNLYPTADCTVFRLALDIKRADRWRAAARRSGCTLEGWITQIVDDASMTVLRDPKHRPLGQNGPDPPQSV